MAQTNIDFGSLGRAEDPKEQDKMLMQLERLIAHYFGEFNENRGQNQNARKILRALSRHTASGGLTMKELHEATGLEPKYLLNRMPGLMQRLEDLFEYSGILLVKDKPQRGSPKYKLACEPRNIEPEDASGNSINNLPFVEITEAMRRRAARFVQHALEARSIEVPKAQLITDDSPSNADSIVANSTWVFYPEKGKHAVVKCLAAAAAEKKALRTINVRNRAFGEGSARDLMDKMENSTYRFAPELGVVINTLKAAPGYVALFYMDPKVRRDILQRLYPANQLNDRFGGEMTYLDEVREFDSELFKNSLARARRKFSKEVRVEPLQLDETQCALFKAVAKAQGLGKPLKATELAEEIGIAETTVHQRIALSQRWREFHQIFMRTRSRSGVECVLLGP